MFSVLRINGGIAAKFLFFAVICYAAVLFAPSPSAALTQDGDGFYLLASASDLETFRDMVNDGNGEINARLTADIDLSRNGEPSEWLPIGNPAFCGVFDGGGHTVSGYVVRAAAAGSGASSATYYSGFFAKIGENYKYGTIKNLILNGSVAPAGDKPLRAGGVAGYLYGSGTLVESKILNCTQLGDVRIESASKEAYAGGIVGYNDSGKIYNCFYSGSVYAAVDAEKEYAGGIVGFSSKNSLDYTENCCWHSSAPSEEEGSGYAQHGIGNNSELKVSKLEGDFQTQPVVTSLAAVADRAGISIGADNTATVTLVTKPGTPQDMSGYIANASVVEGSYKEVVEVAHNGGLTFTVRALAAGETPVTFSASLYPTDFSDDSTLAPSDASQEMTATVHIKVSEASSAEGAAASSGGGGGCSAGFGWLLLSAAALLFFVKKR